MNNSRIAKMLFEIADLLELKGDSVFRIRAYRNAGRKVEDLDREIVDVYEEGTLEDIQGIGEAIADKISEIIETGKLNYLEELRQEFPHGLLQIMDIPDLGPKTTMKLYEELSVSSLEELKAAAREGRIRELKGFGEKTEDNILKGISIVESRTGRMLLGRAYPIASSYVSFLEDNGIQKVSIAGSLRRMKETIGDVDILVGSGEPEEVMEVFVGYEEVDDVIVRGSTKSSVRLKGGEQVDIRVVEVESYGAALQYFTGSKEHNVELRKIAIDKGYKVNEYGIFEKESDERVGGREEKDIYDILGLAYMPPELRENRGELEGAAQGDLPELVTGGEIRGDFHVHSGMSDGESSLEEIVSGCKEMGYEYVGVVDHSESLGVAGGLSPEDILKSVEEAAEISDSMDDFEIIRGAEVDIMPDGSLDYPDDILEELGLVIGAVHSRFNMEKGEMTERILTAMSGGYMDILAHPTGRLIGQREPYDVDMDRIIEGAVEHDVALELNAMPERLDLDDVHCKMAKDRGAAVAIGTDSHSMAQLKHIRWGVATARRGWLESENVLNTLSAREVLDWIER